MAAKNGRTRVVKYDWGTLTLLNDGLIGPNYEIGLTSRMKEWVKPGYLCLDIGAHQGVYTTLLASIAGSSGIVHAFEPHPDNYRMLTANIESNRLSNVVAHNEALGNETGKTTLHHWVKKDGYFNTGMPKLGKPRIINPERLNFEPEHREWEVSINKLDDCKFERKIDFIKMDVEFWESEVVRGGINTLKRDRPDMLVEIHSPGSDNFIRKKAAQNGYRIEKVDAKSRNREHHLLLLH